jgi:D-threo-aldose 1-dehydrogenase
LNTVRLGFGTASVPSNLAGAEFTRLVETALDAGIRHIDTARMYGYGQDEVRLSEVVHRRRDEIVLVSKAGIAPPSTSLPARALRKLSRPLAKVGVRYPRAVTSFVEPQFGRFKPAEIVASLEASLRALQTDHLDALLLHECGPADVTDDLLRALEDLKLAGKILTAGTATSVECTAAIARSHPRAFAIWQFPCSIWERTFARVNAPAGGKTITHSILGARFQVLCRKIAEDASFRAQISSALDLDAADRAALARLFLQEALSTNAGGVVLVSSTNTANIAANARAAGEPADAARIEGLRAFMAASPAAP